KVAQELQCLILVCSIVRNAERLAASPGAVLASGGMWHPACRKLNALVEEATGRRRRVGEHRNRAVDKSIGPPWDRRRAAVALPPLLQPLKRPNVVRVRSGWPEALIEELPAKRPDPCRRSPVRTPRNKSDAVVRPVIVGIRQLLTPIP